MRRCSPYMVPYMAEPPTARADVPMGTRSETILWFRVVARGREFLLDRGETFDTGSESCSTPASPTGTSSLPSHPAEVRRAGHAQPAGASAIGTQSGSQPAREVRSTARVAPLGLVGLPRLLERRQPVLQGSSRRRALQINRTPAERCRRSCFVFPEHNCRCRTVVAPWRASHGVAYAGRTRALLVSARPGRWTFGWRTDPTGQLAPPGDIRAIDGGGLDADRGSDGLWMAAAPCLAYRHRLPCPLSTTSTQMRAGQRLLDRWKSKPA